MNGLRNILTNHLLDSKVRDIIIHTMKLTGTFSFFMY